MTDAGIQNIHVLKVDLTESTLQFKEVAIKTEYGLKQTVKKLLSDNGAVAGVNSDFFGLSGSYSAAFGPIVRDGEVISAGTCPQWTPAALAGRSRRYRQCPAPRRR